MILGPLACFILNLYKLPKLFQQPSPKPILDYYNDMYQLNMGKNMINQMTETMNYSKQAMVLCCYGSYEEAEQLMQKIDQTTLPPALRAQYLVVRVLINCFRENDYGSAGNLCAIIARFNKDEEAVKRKKNDDGLQDPWCVIGMILKNDCTEENLAIIEALISKISSKPALIIEQLFFSWVLAYGYKQVGELQKSEELLALCKKKAPYCTPIHDIKISNAL